VTRSGEPGQTLCRLLRDQKENVEYFSPVRLEGPEHPGACRDELLALLPCDRLVVPSSEALRQAVALVGIERLCSHELIVPGRGTAEVAETLGFQKIVYPSTGGTSEDILNLPALQSVAGLRIAILAAEGGRVMLGRELSERGAAVSRLHVYRRVPLTVPRTLEARLLASGNPITLLASGGALAGLESALSAAAWSHVLAGRMVAPSSRVATLARASGAGHVEVAEGADNASILRALARVHRNPDVCGTLGLNPD